MRTKNRVDTNDVGHECGTEQEKNRDGHEEHGRSVLDRTRATGKPPQGEPNREQKKQSPADTGKEDVEGFYACTTINQGNRQREKGPSDDIVAYAGRQHYDAHGGVEELELGENTTEDGERGDRVCHAGEEHKIRELDGWVDEPVIERYRERRSKAKRDGHAGQGHRHGESRVPFDHGGVDFETDKEQEEAESDVGGEREVGRRLFGEDMLFEARNTAKCRWTCSMSDFC